MNKNIRTDFGFKTVTIGRITIYTGKIRIKESESRLRFVLNNYLQHVRFSETMKDWNKVYTTISFETASASLNKELIRAIMQMMCKIAHDRIDSKYNMYTPEFKETVIESLMDF